MSILTIISDFFAQYIPDFSANLTGYLILIFGALILFKIWRS